MGSELLPDIPLAPPPRRKGVVLAVDDDIGPRESLRMLLKRDYTVHTADGAAAALEIVRRVNPDLVILDILMRPRGGIECLADIRALDPEVAVIMLTGHAAIDSAQAAIRLGANDYLQKPFDKDEMMARVALHVRQTRARRERRRVEQDLRALNLALGENTPRRQSLAHLGMAAATLLHDLRNPLAAAISFLELLEKDIDHLQSTQAGGRVRQDLDCIELALTRCRELTDTWNTMLKPPRQTAEEVPFGSLVRKSVAGVRLNPPGDSAAFSMDGPECEVVGHPVLLERALGNLLLNAVQAAPPGEARVDLRWERDADRLRMTLADNGRGMNAEQVRTLGTPFQTTKGPAEGTGLGLFMARQALLLHGGALRIESEPGRGTTLHLELDVWRDGCLERLPG